MSVPRLSAAFFHRTSLYLSRITLAIALLFAAGLFAADLRTAPHAPSLHGRTLATLSSVAAGESPAITEGRILVAFQDGVPDEEKQQILARFGGDVELTTAGRHFDVLQLAGDELTVNDAIAELQRDPRVRVAEPDYIVHAFDTIPNDPRFANLWGLRNKGQGSYSSTCTACSKPGADISAVKAWDITTGSDSVIVGVIDSGVDYTHPDLAANILRDADGKVIGYDAANKDDDPMDDYGHGTHCAGSIGAVGNNGEGVTGVCWKVRIMPLKFLSASGSGATSDAIACIDYAIAHGAQILSNSWGGSSSSQLLLEAIRRAERKGILFVAAAGNSAVNLDTTPSYPAGYNRYSPAVVAVAATDSNDLLASYSSYGPNTCDIAAPGSLIYSTVPTGTCTNCNASGYAAMSGTSMATPHVAGAAALIRSAYPDATLAQLRLRLLNSADRPAEMDGYTRYGRLNAFRALQTDTVLPGTPKEFAITGASATGLRLTWVASGDDDADGTVAGYRVLYDTNPEMTAPGASSLLLTPGAPGTRETAELTGLVPGITYWLRLVAVDKVGNESSPASAGPATTGAAAFFDGGESDRRFLLLGDSAWVLDDAVAHNGTHSYASAPDLTPDSVSRMTMREYFTVSTPAYASLWVKRDLDTTDAFALIIQDRATGQEVYFSYSGGGPGWERIRVDLSSYAGKQIKLIMNVLRVSNSAAVSHRAWVDDVAIVELTRGPVDDVEGAAQFTGFPPWAVTTESADSPTHAWSDSPGTNYANNMRLPLMQNQSAVLPDTLGSLRIVFRAKADLEPGRDYLQLYASPDDGGRWEPLATLTGKGDWTTYSVPLDGWKKARLLFLLVTNEAVARDGVYLDDIGIWGETFAPVP